MATHKKWGVEIMLFLALLTGCASPRGILPSSEERVIIPSWTTFEEAKIAFDKITPLQTKADELFVYGFDPYKSPNVSVLNYLDIVDRFMPNASIRFEQLDPKVQECILAREACAGYEATVRVEKRQRSGNVLLDLIKFRQTTQYSGWAFNALIVLKDNLVVYKVWSGKPYISEHQESKSPLGFIQKPATKAATGGL